MFATSSIASRRQMREPNDQRRQAILRAREEVAKTILHKDYSALVPRDQNVVNQWVYAAVGAYTHEHASTEQKRLGHAYLRVEALCGPTDERIADIVGHALGAFNLAMKGISEPLPMGHVRRAELEPEVAVAHQPGCWCVRCAASRDVWASAQEGRR